jgi:hypothetical protein
MRAMDALEKVSTTLPEVLAGHEQDVLEDLSTSELPEMRWHVGLLIPRLRLNDRRLPTAIAVLDRLLHDPSRIVQANALEGVVRLADVTTRWPSSQMRQRPAHRRARTPRCGSRPAADSSRSLTAIC